MEEKIHLTQEELDYLKNRAIIKLKKGALGCSFGVSSDDKHIFGNLVRKACALSLNLNAIEETLEYPNLLIWYLHKYEEQQAQLNG